MSSDSTFKAVSALPKLSGWLQQHTSTADRCEQAPTCPPSFEGDPSERFQPKPFTPSTLPTAPVDFQAQDGLPALRTISTRKTLLLPPSGCQEEQHKDEHAEHMWRCGRNYQGEWHDGLRNGLGTEAWSDGRKYKGQWRNNAFEGKGVWMWADGRILQGVFSKYCPLEGKLFMPNGAVFEVAYAGCHPVLGGSTPPPAEIRRVEDPEKVEKLLEDLFDELAAPTTNMANSDAVLRDDVSVTSSHLSAAESVPRCEEHFEVVEQQTVPVVQQQVVYVDDNTAHLQALKQKKVPYRRRNLHKMLDAEAVEVPRRKSFSLDVTNAKELARRIAAEISVLAHPFDDDEDDFGDCFGTLNTVSIINT